MDIKELIARSNTGELTVEFLNCHFINTPRDFAKSFYPEIILSEIYARTRSVFKLFSVQEYEEIEEKLSSNAGLTESAYRCFLASLSDIDGFSGFELFIESYFREKCRNSSHVLRLKFYVENGYLTVSYIEEE